MLYSHIVHKVSIRDIAVSLDRSYSCIRCIVAAYKAHGQTNRLRNYMQKESLLDARSYLPSAPPQSRGKKLVLQTAQNSNENIKDSEPSKQLKEVEIADEE